MAHGVKRTVVLSVHQALHGYSDGHRQLAASVQLKPRDIKTMLVLSDISGPGTRIDDAGYLTGYPLGESKFYALARTWAAPEMPRPGCVWTHTILIDFADLAALDDPDSVLSAFRRPSAGASMADYGSSQSVHRVLPTQGLRPDAAQFAKQILAGLYGRPQSRVIATKPAELDVEQIVMALWAQQWPRLRRAFRFCTHSAADRSIEPTAFDLQFLPSLDRSVRARFQDAYDISEAAPLGEAWLDDAASDLTQSDATGLRSFLRGVGGDVDSGREAFASLCRLHVFLNELSANPAAINSAIVLLEKELLSDQARSARGIVATAALRKADVLPDMALDFLDQNLEFAEPALVSQSGGRFGREVWKRKPERFAQWLEGTDVQRAVATAGLATLSSEELVDGLAHLPQLAAVALAHKPEVVSHPKFWSHAVAPVDEAFAVLRTSENLREPALAAAIIAQRADLSDRAVREMGALGVLAVAGNLFDAAAVDRRSFMPWLSAATTDPATISRFLTDGPARSSALLTVLARMTTPDAAPNVDGRDPWLAAATMPGDAQAVDGNQYLCAFLFARALGHRSSNSGELAQISFEPLYAAMAADLLPDDAWRLIEPRLPWGLNWFTSDRCPRLRTAVAELFVERDLSPRLVAKIAKDNAVFELVAETMARTSRGRRFLGQVSRALRGETGALNHARIQVIESLID
jgi:hypothetical protein